MSSNFHDRRVTLPNDATLGDDPADVGAVSAYPTVSTADIVQGLVDRSGNPRQAMGTRYGTDYLCSQCLGSPDQPMQDGGHPYEPMIDRTPGVHQDVDFGRVHNFDPYYDTPGQDQTAIIGDPEIDSGRAEARWNQATSRQRRG
jgi:hypothetical protein